MNKVLFVAVGIILIFISVLKIAISAAGGKQKMSDSYLRKREEILLGEKSKSIGGALNLTDEENEANEVILSKKKKELEDGHLNSSLFLPSNHFFTAKSQIDRSEVFEIIQKIPKGASLHTHLLAAVSIDFLMDEITHKDNLYGGFINDIFKLKFFKDPSKDERCEWKSLKDYRAEKPNFDAWLRSKLTLQVANPREVYPTVEIVWRNFKNLFSTAYDMLCYKPIFEIYIYRLLQELHDDNIFYAELKGTFMPLYDLEGRNYSTREFFEIFIQTVAEFKKDHADFIGVRYIHSIYRGVDKEILKKGLDELISYQKEFPDFIAGFDFVGWEEEGKYLVDYREELLEAKKHLKYFFHAGETNWFGSTDENLVDAILLNATRIGHGFALIKHPILLEMIKERKIAIEICPISNQVLMLNEDPRNHPATHLVSKGIPLVIGNDDPSLWGAKGLSYDWYIFFMAMTRKSDGIAVLKQISMNSIEFSCMNEQEKIRAKDLWKRQWEQFVQNIK